MSFVKGGVRHPVWTSFLSISAIALTNIVSIMLQQFLNPTAYKNILPKDKKLQIPKEIWVFFDTFVLIKGVFVDHWSYIFFEIVIIARYLIESFFLCWILSQIVCAKELKLYCRCFSGNAAPANAIGKLVFLCRIRFNISESWECFSYTFHHPLALQSPLCVTDF